MIAALTNHLWQSTLFVLAAWLVAAALRKNGAHVRHRIWLIASLKFLLPFSLLMSLGGLIPTVTPVAAALTAPVTSAAPDLSAAVDRIAQPFTSDVFFETSPATTTQGATDWTTIGIVGIWACGFAAIVILRLRGWRRIRAAMRTSAPVPVLSPVPVRSSPGLLEPGVVGLWRPVLLMPAGIEQHLTTSQLEAVLAHELCHVQRRDNLTSAIHMVVEAMFWFHPLVWFVGARLVDERERACDEHVLRVCGEPQAYAESILNVCKLYLESPLACVSGVGGADLKKRVTAIMANHIGLRLTRAGKLLLTLAAVLAAGLPIVAGMLIASPSAAAPASGKDLATAGTQSGTATAGQAAPAFDIVSIKPCPSVEAQARSGPRGAGPSAAQVVSPGYIHWDCVTLAELVEQGYVPDGQPLQNNVHWTQLKDFMPQPVRGGPAWVRSDKFAIEVRGAELVTAPPKPGQRNLKILAPPMAAAIRSMLEDRFQLKVRRVTEERPMYALMVAKGGLKITPTPPGSCKAWEQGMSRGASPWKSGESPVCGGIWEGLPPAKMARLLAGEPLATVAAMPGPNRRMEFTKVTLDALVRTLVGLMDRFVLDRTAVAGEFTFALEFTGDDRSGGDVAAATTPIGDGTWRSSRLTTQEVTRGPEPSGTAGGPTLFQALEALGLKLEPTRGPAEYLQIESVQKLRPNAPADDGQPPLRAQGAGTPGGPR